MNSVFSYLKIPAEFQEGFKQVCALSSKNPKSTNFYFLLFKVITAVLISDFLLLLQRSKNRPFRFNRNIFVTHYSHVVKGKGLSSVFSDNEFSILYVPTVHNKVKKKHLANFRNTNNVYFDTFGLSVLKRLILMFKDAPLISRIHKEYQLEYPAILEIIIKHKLFSFYWKKFHNLSRQNGFIWFFDNDRDLSFSPFVQYLNLNNRISVNLQHGIFFENNRFYLPSISKYVFCCSEREKNLFIKSGHNPADIYVVGAPLQAQIPDLSGGELSQEFDVLVLLAASSENYLSAQISILRKLASMTDCSVLIRFRPSTQSKDQIVLQDYIDSRFTISSSTLDADLNSSGIVISFSFDALFTCIRWGKKTIFVCSDEIHLQLRSSSNPLLLPYSRIVDLESYLHNVFPSDVDNFIWNFGNHNLTDYRVRFREICSLIKEQTSNEI